RDFQRVAFGHELADQAGVLRLRRVDAAARQQQIAHEGVAQVALQSRNAAETGDQPEAQFGKTEARQLVGDNQIAKQRKLEPAAERHAVNRRDRGQRRSVNRVRHTVDSIEEIADQRGGLVETDRFRAKVKLAQVGASAETGFHRAVNDQRMRFVFQSLVGLDELFKLFESFRADLIARRAMQNELYASVNHLPR